MGKYTFEIPTEVEDWLLKVKNTQPQTYIQNQFIDSLIKEYEQNLGEAKRLAAEVETKKEVDKIKTDISVKVESKVK